MLSFVVYGNRGYNSEGCSDLLSVKSNKLILENYIFSVPFPKYSVMGMFISV